MYEKYELLVILDFNTSHFNIKLIAHYSKYIWNYLIINVPNIIIYKFLLYGNMISSYFFFLVFSWVFSFLLFLIVIDGQSFEILV